jgi:hypothetical protein
VCKILAGAPNEEIKGMTSIRSFWVFWTLASLSVAAPLWGGTISTIGIDCPSQGAAGNGVSCAVDLFLVPGVTVEDLTFGLLVTPNDSAPALARGRLIFTDSIGPVDFESSQGNNATDVLWGSLDPALSGSLELGSMRFVLPASAVGQSYSVAITGASADDPNGDIVSLAIGPADTISVVPDPATGGLTAICLLALANPWAVRRRRATRPNA